MIIDGSNLILGRLASFAAKRALLGEKIDIINCEEIVVSGKRKQILEDIKARYARGEYLKGPFPSRRIDRFVRRSVRGMLPYNQYKGKIDFKKVMCYRAVPDKFKDQKFVTFKNLNIEKTKSLNYIYLKEIEKYLGYGQI